MATLANLNPFSTFTELDGDPIDNGYIYIGVAGQNPKQFPITVYWDELGTVPAQQPLRTNGGYVTRNGKPAQVYVNSSYSILVEDRKRRQVFYVPSFTPQELRGSLQKVNSYADLRLYSGIEPVIYVASGFSLGDGGEGVFYYDQSDTTTADNSWLTIVGVAGKRFKRHLDPLYSLSAGMGLSTSSAIDNGPRLNEILQLAAANKIALTGSGKTFYSRTPILPQSGQRLKNVRFVSMGAPSGDTTAKSHIPLIHINGISSAKTDIIMEDVYADGSRQLWPNISTSTAGPDGGGGEDGGMHAWRLSGIVTNSRFVKCSGNNSGTAGWAIHNPTPSTSVVQYLKTGLVFEDCDGIGNREHGMFADSFDGIVWRGGKLTENGLDLNTTDPLTSGTRGCRDTNGKLFGMPFDLESYGPNFFGSLFKNFKMFGTDCRGNAIMATIYCPIASNLATFAQLTDFMIVDCDLDSGLAAVGDRPAGTAGLGINVLGNLSGSVYPFSRLTVNSRVNGIPQFNGVDALDMSSGYIASTGQKAILNNSKRWDLSCAGESLSLTLSPALNVTITKTAGAAGAAIIPTLNSSRAATQSGIELIYALSITGATAVGGTLAANITPPAGYLVDSCSIDVITLAILPIGAASIINSGAGTATIYVNTSADTNLAATLTVTLLPSA